MRLENELENAAEEYTELFGDALEKLKWGRYVDWSNGFKETVTDFIDLFKKQIKKNNAILKQNDNKFTFTYHSDLLKALRDARGLLEETFSAGGICHHESHSEEPDSLSCYNKDLLNLFRQWNKFDIKDDTYDYDYDDDDDE